MNRIIRRYQHGPELSTLLAIVAAGLVLCSLAYQFPFSHTLAIGGDPATHRREDDAPFLHGFNASEPYDRKNYRWWTLPPGYAYRWTTSQATVRLPGVGEGRWIVTLMATSGRPQGLPALSTWQAGEHPLPPIAISAAPRSYAFLADTGPAGDLRLQMNTPPYVSPFDPRDLGFALRGVRVAPTATGLRLPSLAQLGWIALVLLLFSTLSRWLALSRRQTLVLSLAVALLLAFLLATHRLALTIYTPTLAGLLAGCWLLAAFLQRIAGSLLLPACRKPRPLVALIVLAFALRLGGMLHPQARFSDHRMNANNLFELASGRVYFTEGLPDEAGGGKAPYPPGSYLLIAPSLLVAPADIESRVLLVQSGVALLDSLTLALLWVLLHRAGVGARAALWGAALYLLPAPMMQSFSIGEYANIGGQALALPVLVLLAWCPDRPRTWHAPYLLCFVALLCLGWLGHMGVAISLACFLLAWWLLTTGETIRKAGPHRKPAFRHIATVSGGMLLAATLVAFFYYLAPPFLPIFAGRLAEDAAIRGTPAAPLLETLRAIGRGFFASYSPLTPVLTASGLVGTLRLWQISGRKPHATPVVRVVLAWWGATLLSFGLLLFAQQGVRWQHFLYPALCLGAAPLLENLLRRGTAGRMVAGAGLLLPIAHGLVVWITHIRDYLH